MTHTDLVALGYRWLKHRTTICFSDGFVTSSSEIPDVIGWRGPNSILIECKATRRDFMADKKKLFRRYPYLGIGRERYYLCPVGIISIEDLPDNWGLLWAKGKRIYVKQKPGQVYFEINTQKELSFLVSMLRRVQVRLDDTELNDWLRIQNMRAIT